MLSRCEIDDVLWVEIERLIPVGQCRRRHPGRGASGTDRARQQTRRLHPGGGDLTWKLADGFRVAHELGRIVVGSNGLLEVVDRHVISEDFFEDWPQPKQG